MKLLCYGASVTAQKFETGYFSQLLESNLNENFSEIERIAFGASQYEYAGYAFINDVLEKKPDVCFIDWLTPGMKAFSPFKIDLLNQALLAQNCLPVWGFFPRVKNFNELPEAYNQVKASATQYHVPFIDFRTEMPDFPSEPEKYLRDDVHTTLEGALCYANKIVTEINDILPKLPSLIKRARNSEKYLNFASEKVNPPSIRNIGKTIDNDNSIEFNFNFPGGLLEVFFETDVGPHMCLTQFSLFNEEELVFEHIFNNADPWSHYKRHMVIETLRKRFPQGNYRLVVKKQSGNPFDEKQTKKPIEENWEEHERFLLIKRASISVADFEVKTCKVG